MNQKSINEIAYGDFQTPVNLTDEISNFLVSQGLLPQSLIEPTCGRGTFISSAIKDFESLKKVMGIDINKDHIDYARKHITNDKNVDVDFFVEDFFAIDWGKIVEDLPEPILILGNPPWVTNSELAKYESKNSPNKSNFQNLKGIDAITGKGNFDISEWMMIHLLERLELRKATFALLCKTSAARKVLTHLWKIGVHISDAKLYIVDAKKYFGVSVDACLLVCQTSQNNHSKTANLYGGFYEQKPKYQFGLVDGKLIADVDLYEGTRDLSGQSPYIWRSGIKHDASKIMELKKTAGKYENKLGEVADLESEFLFPMLKSSHIANGNTLEPSLWMLVPQRKPGKNTQEIESLAPKTWKYLSKNSKYLDNRRSSIYKNKPRYSIFGVGEYSFSPWKVVISGLYKKIHFEIVGSYQNKPIVLDDTCYFIPCQNQEEATFLSQLLNSDLAQNFFKAQVFWDAKRPITSSLLNQLNISLLASQLRYSKKLSTYLRNNKYLETNKQMSMPLNV